MNRIFYAERDTTIYEKANDQNTGIDEILSITNEESSNSLGFFPSRILIQFRTPEIVDTINIEDIENLK